MHRTNAALVYILHVYCLASFTILEEIAVGGDASCSPMFPGAPFSIDFQQAGARHYPYDCKKVRHRNHAKLFTYKEGNGYHQPLASPFDISSNTAPAARHCCLSRFHTECPGKEICVFRHRLLP